ncbi:MAG: SUF system NifU family Fe-S cluster assembly protein [Gammaproteobacteria bacterium]|nr:SUF system NifU family Fe-S cluster assembly protein [Gammaproteobacteria bacterium]
MMDLKDLYQEIIVDHNRRPRNFGRLDDADRILEGFNPLCGDRLTLYLKLDDHRIRDIRFDGSGCAISVASASLMTEAMKGKTVDEAAAMFDSFHGLLTSDANGGDLSGLGKLAALAGVRDYPTRVKCATLCWHTLRSALAGSQSPVSTE